MTEVTKEEYAKRRRKWLEALRSGKYNQGRQCLRDAQNNFCCLGVAEDVRGAKWETPLSPVRAFIIRTVGSYEHSVLTPVGRAYYGIGSLGQSKLVQMNDTGATFEQIADYIEHNPRNNLWLKGTY